ncbi:hypothetical protein VPH35_052603 [Triticum aestivum]|uniref:Uncharacterized protein n=2 Tax=Triticum TaxID=4564 RepID=A0A077RQR3_WHEAT|nr:unnamed protein product [Triticum aestivum]CDM83451.1 unnamed protein product [Triticum aestivum]VAH78589.1 unnamed protein product [Triticum turgidum subsp. durum]
MAAALIAATPSRPRLSRWHLETEASPRGSAACTPPEGSSLPPPRIPPPPRKALAPVARAACAPARARRRSRARRPATRPRLRGGWRWARSCAPPPCSAAVARHSRRPRTPSRRLGSGCGWRHRFGGWAGPTTMSCSPLPHCRCSRCAERFRSGIGFGCAFTPSG